MTEKPKEETKNLGFIIDEDMKNVNLQNSELKPIEKETEFISVFQKMRSIFFNLKETDWTVQVGAINYLRRLLKYEKQMFNQAFYGLRLYPKVIELINSVRSSLAKITLVLLKEILNSSSENESEEKDKEAKVIPVIKLIIPCLITKVNSNQSFIKKDANECLDLIIEKEKNVQILSILANHIRDLKKQQELDFTCSMIIKFIKSLDKDYLINNLHNPILNEVMKSICSFYEWKKTANEKKFKGILDAFSEVMTKEEFLKKIEKCNRKEKEMIKLLLEKKNKKEKPDLKRAKSITKINLKAIFKETKNIEGEAAAHAAEIKTPNIKVMPIKRNLSVKNKVSVKALKENKP